jgi:hypothetical protein
LVRNLTGREHSEDLGVDGMILLEWILGKYDGRVWTGCIWLRMGTSGGFCEHGNKLPCSIKGGDIIAE